MKDPIFNLMNSLRREIYSSMIDQISQRYWYSNMALPITTDFPDATRRRKSD